MDQTLPHSEVLISELAGDPDLAELIALFVRELPERAKAIQQAVEEVELESSLKLAHQLKGAAGSYGFPAITKAAAAFEQSTRNGCPLEQLAAEAEKLVALCRRARTSA